MDVFASLISGNAGIAVYSFWFVVGICCDYNSKKFFQTHPFILFCAFLMSYKTHDWNSGVALCLGYGVEMDRFKSIKEIILGITARK